MKHIKKIVLPNGVTLLLNQATVRKIISLFLLSIFLGYNSPISPHGKINWKKISIDINCKNFQFISAKSIDDFWMENSQGGLYHFTKGNLLKYEIPQSSSFISFRFFKITNDEFFIITLDKDYYSRIFHFYKNHFSLSMKHSEMPIMGILQAANKFYAYGNWGYFFVLRNGIWEKIETPIENHIQAAIFSEKYGILLGTRGEGIYAYNDKKFKKIPTEISRELDIIKLYKDEKKQIHASAINEELIFDGSSFKTLRKTNIKNPPFGFQEIVLTNNSISEKIRIPVEKEYRNGILADDGSILILNAQGEVFHSFYQSLNYFNRYDYTYQIEGHANENSHGAAFIHLNDDFLPELFVLNTNNSSKLYLNRSRKSFIDLSYSIEKLNSGSLDKFIFADINSDYFLDFVGTTAAKRSKKFSIFFGEKEQNFSQENIFLSNILGDINNLRLVDLNTDGDVDLLVSQYLNKNRGIGNTIKLINHKYKKSFSVDSSNNSQTKSWNLQTIFADFDNDNFDDIYIVQKWRRDKLFLSHDGRLVDKTDSHLYDLKPFNTFAATSFDYNNDGNLDIVLLSEENTISLIENNGKGNFKDVTSEKFPSDLSIFRINPILGIFINSGDINNDGFTDILLYVKSYDFLKQFCLINFQGKYFKDLSDSMNIAQIDLAGNILGDIDNDGDLDIYGFRNGHNILWLNNLDDKNFIKLFIKGVISNTQGIGTKIWLYKAGRMNNNKHLIGYKQIGCDISGANSYNDITAHFGVGDINKVDIKIRFPSGKEKRIYNVNAGQSLIIEELGGISKELYLLPGTTARFFLNPAVQIYILITIFSGFILYFGIRNGLKKYKWELSLTIILIVINLTLFWTLILLTIESENILKYLLPPSSILVGIAMPNIIFFYITKKHEKEIGENSLDSLFDLLINFSHGEWALRNLNSLQMFFQNINSLNINDQAIIEQFEKRKVTFTDLTYPTLLKIILTSKKIKNFESISNALNFLCEKISKGISSKSDSNRQNQAFALNLGNDFEEIKKLLSKLKTQVFTEFSCGVVEITSKVVDELNPLFESESISIEKKKSFDEDAYVLIKNLDLADVLDNLLRNAASALHDSTIKNIRILIYKKTPKIIIEISDTGKGIKADDFEKIFEYGFSNSGGTGKGLFLTRKILQKYGSRIYLKESVQNAGSTFLIELNEGYQNETKSANH